MIRAWLLPQPVQHSATQPKISVIVAAYNEASVIQAKIESLLRQSYPAQQTDIIVASDGSDDGTDEVVRSYELRGIRLLALPRQGKNATLNSAVAAATGEILVFSDADSLLPIDSLQHLIAPFGDPKIGVVGGDYQYSKAAADVTGEQTYWDFDRILKQLQSRAGSLSSVSGALYAVRRDLFKPLPLGVTDDFYTTAQVVTAHKRAIFEPHARSYGPATSSTQEEFKRKVRVMTRGLRGVWLCRHLFSPLHYGFYSIQLLTHKVLRRLVIMPMLVLLITAPLLQDQGTLYQWATWGQVIFHSLALISWVLQMRGLRPPKPLRMILFFDLVNLAAVVAVMRLIWGEQRTQWTPSRAEPSRIDSDESVDLE